MIGIFDSGSGGLTVLSELKRLMPNIAIIYFGDIKNAPYGEKNREEIGALTILGFQRLLQTGATEIISACNSVSVSITLPIMELLETPPKMVIEMVGPTVAHFKANRDKKVLVVATPATIDSGMYQLGFSTIGMSIVFCAIPELAGAIEHGSDSSVIEAMIHDSLRNIPKESFDTLILGCTHYPLVKDNFNNVLTAMQHEAEIVDPARFVAERAIARCVSKEEGSICFLLSEDSPVFRAMVEKMCARYPYTIEILG